MRHPAEMFHASSTLAMSFPEREIEGCVNAELGQAAALEAVYVYGSSNLLTPMKVYVSRIWSGNRFKPGLCVCGFKSHQTYKKILINTCITYNIIMIGWLAGLIDGEGSFMIHVSTKLVVTQFILKQHFREKKFSYPIILFK